jgi:hypothetical protein
VYVDILILTQYTSIVVHVIATVLVHVMAT